jgi:hypothetical protein
LPEWLREVVLALGAFVGGRSINALTDAHRERMMMRDTMTRLTIGIESISSDLHEIKGEVRTQASALREEMAARDVVHERRMHAMEWRIDGISARIDFIAPNTGPIMPPPHDDE